MSHMDGSTGKDMEMAVENEKVNDQGKGQRRRERIEENKMENKRIYAKEATVTVDMGDVNDARAEDLIKVLAEKIGVGKMLAVRPKQNRLYEVTLTNEETCDELVDGLEIKGVICEVKKLQEREYAVSFMHLPAYLEDQEILDKLRGWGVIPSSRIRRRYYPGTEIEDGTRFVRVKFPKEVASLPYSTRFETAEGTQHFRIIHNRQVKTCRLCMNPDHVFKDCPEFRCYKCEQQGHFARDCIAARCRHCQATLNKCECWIAGEREEEEEQQEVGVQMLDETAETQIEEYRGEAKAERIKAAERIEDGVSTTEEESTYMRNEHMEMETRKRDSEIEEDSDTCERNKKQKAKKEDKGSVKERRSVEEQDNEDLYPEMDSMQGSQIGEQGQQETEVETMDKTEMDKEEMGSTEWEKVMTTRRRLKKVTPSVEFAQKRHITREKCNEKGAKRQDCDENCFEVLVDLEEGNE